MKKITLISLILFTVAVTYIYFSGLKSSHLTSSPGLKPLTTTIFKQPLMASDIASPTPAEGSDGSVLDKNEVAKHSTPDDCYLVINNNVYDVSSYTRLHPGGKRQITSRCGTEVTGIFAQIHSNRAWDLLAKYKIGTLTKSSAAAVNSIKFDLNAIEDDFKKANPAAEVVNIKPKNDFYVAKVIYNNKLYEVHIDLSGEIIKEELENDEFNWSLWDTDKDDEQ